MTSYRDLIERERWTLINALIVAASAYENDASAFGRDTTLGQQSELQARDAMALVTMIEQAANVTIETKGRKALTLNYSDASGDCFSDHPHTVETENETTGAWLRRHSTRQRD